MLGGGGLLINANRVVISKQAGADDKARELWLDETLLANDGHDVRLRFQFLAAVELVEVDGGADDYRVVADKNRRVVVVDRHILD